MEARLLKHTRQRHVHGTRAWRAIQPALNVILNVSCTAQGRAAQGAWHRRARTWCRWWESRPSRLPHAAQRAPHRIALAWARGRPPRALAQVGPQSPAHRPCASLVEVEQRRQQSHLASPPCCDGELWSCSLRAATEGGTQPPSCVKFASSASAPSDPVRTLCLAARAGEAPRYCQTCDIEWRPHQGTLPLRRPVKAARTQYGLPRMDGTLLGRRRPYEVEGPRDGRASCPPGAASRALVQLARRAEAPRHTSSASAAA